MSALGEKVGGIYFETSLDTQKLLDGERQARRSLDRVGQEGDRLQTRMTKISAAIGAALGAIAVQGLAQKLVSVQRQFDVLFSSLKTVTGGTEAANAQFEQLRKFAAQTPYSLEQAVKGFVKLKALGLDPSERAMLSYGNTASAMGKSLEQMIEAVADASTSEFERLKEFGIKAKTEGDKVTFTFQGVSTTVRNSAKEITEYLTRIGEVNFAGAMSERMKTLDGDISNLQDSIDGLFLALSKSGVGDAIAAGVRKATEAVQELEASVKQGELTAYFDGLRPVLQLAEVAVVTLAGSIAGKLVQAMIAAGVRAYATATAIGAATLAVRGFTAVLAALGGPIGIAITGLAMLALNWENVGGQARDAATMAEEASRRIASALNKSAAAAGNDLASQLREAASEIAGIDKELANTKFPMASDKDLAELRQRRDSLVKISADIREAIGKNALRSGDGYQNRLDRLANPPKKEAGSTAAGGASTSRKGKAAHDSRVEFPDALQGMLDRINSGDELKLQKLLDTLEEMKKFTAAGGTLPDSIWAGMAEDIAKLDPAAREARKALDLLADTPSGKQQAMLGTIAEINRHYAEGRLTVEQWGEAIQAATGTADDGMSRLNAILAETPTAKLEDTLKQIEFINAQFAAGNIKSAEQWAEAIRVVTGTGDNGPVEAAQKGIDVAREMGLTFSSAFEDAIVEGENFRDVLKGLEQDIKRIITRKLVTEPLAEGVTGMVQGLGNGQGLGGIVSTIGNFVAGMFGGARATGGPVEAGRLYRVNERGRPEMYQGADGSQWLMPTRNGRVIPPQGGAAAGAAGGGMAVHNTFYLSGPVDQRTQQHIAAASARGVQRAIRRGYA